MLISTRSSFYYFRCSRIRSTLDAFRFVLDTLPQPLPGGERCTWYKHMYRYVGPVVSAIDTSDLGQVLSRKRTNARWGAPFGMVFARRSSPCSSFPTLPEAASAVLASSRRVFSFFSQNFCSDPSYLFARIYIYNLIIYQALRDGPTW